MTDLRRTQKEGAVPMSSSVGIHCSELFSSWIIATAIAIFAVAMLSLWRYFSRTTSLRIAHLAIFVGFGSGLLGLLAWQMHRDSIRAENLAALKAFHDEAGRLLEESLSSNNVADYKTQRTKAEMFSEKVEKWAANNIGPRASDILQHHEPTDVGVKSESATDKDQQSAITENLQTREKIAALIDARARDRCVRPRTTEHPVPQMEFPG